MGAIPAPGTSDDQALYQLVGNATPIDANNKEADDGVVTLKAIWAEQKATITYGINDDSNGMGIVTLNVDGEVASATGDALTEDVLKFHGNDVMGATATANPGYRFVHWLVNKKVNGATPMSSQSVVVRAASANGAMVAQDVADTAGEWYIYSTDASINPGKDETVLYPEATYMAVFAENSYTIAYDANYSGASKISTTTPASWDATGLLGSVATPTRKTYTFEGWYTAPTGGKQVTKNSKYNREDLEGATATLNGSAVDLDTDGATVTLYAHWNVKDADLDKLLGDSGTIEKDTTGSADGSDVPKDKYWVPADVQNELDAALANAQKVADDPNATGEARIAAYERLQAAYNAYNAAKKPGTKVEESSDDNGGDNGGNGNGNGNGSATKGSSKSSTWKAPTTGDHLTDAMILVGGIAAVAAFVLLLAIRRRDRRDRQ